jgi:hypothetical protein
MKRLKLVASFALMTSIAQVLSVSSFASGTTPELQLLAGMIALNGQNIGADQANQAMDGLVKTYLADSVQMTGDRQERMVEAMVDLNIATHPQAEQLANATNAADLSTSSTDAALSNEIHRIASTSLLGAQYSQNSGCVFVPLFLTGVAASFGYGSYAITQENLPGVSSTTRYVVSGTVAALGAISLAFAIQEITSCR